MKYRCPICGKETDCLDGEKPQNPYRPFCSQRCRYIDLGCWLEGSYRLEVQEDYRSDEDSSVQFPNTDQNSARQNGSM